jgi:hypothetical protein
LPWEKIGIIDPCGDGTSVALAGSLVGGLGLDLLRVEGRHNSFGPGSALGMVRGGGLRNSCSSCGVRSCEPAARDRINRGSAGLGSTEGDVFGVVGTE